MPTITYQEALDAADAILTSVNEHCGSPVLSDFRGCARQPSILESCVNIYDTVVIEMYEISAERIVKQTIKAHERMITALQATKEKLEELQKKLT